MAYVFLSILFLWMDLRVHLCFLKTEALREPRFPAAADAAAVSYTHLTLPTTLHV